MITVVSGNDTFSSRNYLFEQKDSDSVTFDAESVELSELEGELSDSKLFRSVKKIFIENLFSPKAKQNYKNIIDIVEKNHKDKEIFIWEGSEVSLRTLSSFPKHTIKSFKIPQNIFYFLDNIKPGNKQSLTMFHDVLKTTEPQIIFFMIIRRFRLMLGIIENSKNIIDELKRLAPWQKSKIIRQADIFGIDRLKFVYKKLYKIDKGQKTGSSGLNLTQQIDMLLLEI